MLDWYWVRGQLVELYIVVLHGKRRKAGCARLGLGKPNLPQGWAVPAEAQPYMVQSLPGRVQQGRSQDYREAENVTRGDSAVHISFCSPGPEVGSLSWACTLASARPTSTYVCGLGERGH